MLINYFFQVWPYTMTKWGLTQECNVGLTTKKKSLSDTIHITRIKDNNLKQMQKLTKSNTFLRY